MIGVTDVDYNWRIKKLNGSEINFKELYQLNPIGLIKGVKPYCLSTIWIRPK